MTKRIIMVTGGQRSGKSVMAERLALEPTGHALYVATAQVHDDEMADRVRRHQKRRGAQWATFEEPLHIGAARVPAGCSVLVDCLTLLSTNAYFAAGEDIDIALANVKREVDALAENDCVIVFVTNEIGMGGISANAMMRRFTDLMGWVNAYVAAKADDVYLMVSGIPMKIK